MTSRSKPRGDIGPFLRSYGVILSAVLAVFTALSPLFGKAGLLRVVPVPPSLAPIGPPLALMVSIVAFLLIFVIHGSRKKSVRPFFGVLISSVLALLSLSFYLSHIQEGIEFPSIMFLTGKVFALYLFVFIIASWTSVFAFLGVILFQRDEETPDRLSTAYETAPSSPQAQPKSQHAVENLSLLVQKAEWQGIVELARTAPKIGLWSLYGSMGKEVVRQGSLREQKRAIARARFWYRALTIRVNLIPNVVSRVKVVDRRLCTIAGLMLKVASLRVDIAEKLAKRELTRPEVYVLCLNQFAIAVGNPPQYGYDRVYDDMHKAFTYAVRQRRRFDYRTELEMKRMPLLLGIQVEDALARMKAGLSFSTGARERTLVDQYLQLFRDIMRCLLDGSLDKVSSKALVFAREMMRQLHEYPPETPQPRLALLFAGNAFCIAAATWAEINESNLGDFFEVMHSLCSLALMQWQGLAACNLTREWEGKVGSLLSAIKKDERQWVESLGSMIAEVRVEAEKIRGLPCPE